MWPFKKKESPLKELVKSQVLMLQPGDTLVIATDADYDGPTVNMISTGLKKATGFDVGVLLVPGDTDVFVLRSGLPRDGKPAATPVPSDGDPKTP